LQFRLELLRSRLPLLYDSDEGRLLQEVAAQKDAVQRYEAVLDTMIDVLPDLSPNPEIALPVLRKDYYALEPLGRLLQRVLMQSIAYNEEIFRREREVAASPAIVPFALLFVSGTCLVVILFLLLLLAVARLELTHWADDLETW